MHADRIDALNHISIGLCPECPDCAATYGCTQDEFRESCEKGTLCDEGAFSWASCGLCGATLAGTRYTWHAIDSDGHLVHDEDACEDCLIAYS